VCYTCISISSLVGRKVCSILLVSTRLLILMHIKHTASYLHVNRLPENKLLFSKLVKKTSKIKMSVVKRCILLVYNV